MFSGIEFGVNFVIASSRRSVCQGAAQKTAREKINNGNRTESNSVCNHTGDKQNRMTAKRESDLLITSMITD